MKVDSATIVNRLALAPLKSLLLKQRARTVVAACSGGSDSVALAVALQALQAELKLSPIIVHINHQLRGAESRADQAFVQSLGRRLGLPVRVYVRPVKKVSGNLEEMARDARYGALCALAKRSGALVLTGHTLDDQAETVLMNLVRGCGPDGLSGMAPVRMDDATGVKIGRPWLKTTHEDLRRFLLSRKIGFREDSSNRDLKYLRNYVRLKLFKELERRAPGLRDRLARLAEMTRDEQPQWETWLNDASDLYLKPHQGGKVLDGRSLGLMPLGLQRRLLRRAAGNDLLTFDGVERLRVWIQSPPSNGRIFELRKGWAVERLSRSGGSPSSSLFWFHESVEHRRPRLKPMKQRIKTHG